MLLTTIGSGGGVDTHAMIIFLELFNIFHENNFLNKYKNRFGPIIIFFPLLLQFHCPSLLNDIQVEILIFGQKMRMEINNF
jgi:hypothetical protein